MNQSPRRKTPKLQRLRKKKQTSDLMTRQYLIACEKMKLKIVTNILTVSSFCSFNTICIQDPH